MKKNFALILILFLIIGCEETPTGPDIAPTVSFEAIGNGEILRLTWTALSNVDGYKVYIDGTLDTTITQLSYDVSTPCKTIEICGYKEDKESPKWSYNFAPVITSLTVYGRSDTSRDHPSGFGFTTEGSAVTYSLSDSTNRPKVDFYIEDVLVPISLWSPHHRDYNKKENAGAEATVTEFDSLRLASAPGSYSTQTPLSTNGLYSIWIDPNADGWDSTNDHFGKLKVIEISGAKVEIKVAYQKVPGLRWVVTK